MTRFTTTAITTDAREILAAFAERQAARLALPKSDLRKWRIDQTTPEEFQAALAVLETDTTRCGRCGWVQDDPRPGMPAYQIAVHAVDHLRLEDLPTDKVIFNYRMRVINTRMWRIARSELERRGIDPGPSA